LSKPEGIAEITGAPRVEACIEAVIERYPGVSSRARLDYFEAVHQELAPLARKLEVELADAKRALVEERLRLERELEKCNADWNKRYRQWGETEDRLRAELKGLYRYKAGVDEALNTGDGTYKP
jgi:hypothetical protein